MLTYESFDLLITPAADGYSARVIASPHGEAAGSFQLPPTIREQRNNLRMVGGAIRAFKFLGADSPTIQPLDPQQFGERLFAALFTSTIGTCWRQSVDFVRSRGKGLRLRLRLDETPELAALPWEYLYDPAERQYLVLAADISVVRYLALPQSEESLAVARPLQILVLTADATDYTRLDIATEEARLQTALQPLEAEGQVTVTWLRNGTLADLRRTLRRHTIHILHFIGHGWFEQAGIYSDNGLLLVDESGKGLQVAAETLGMHLHNHRTLRLALLNACEGARLATETGEPFAGVAQQLVQQGIPAVLAMQFPISDRAAIELTRTFYTALTTGESVDGALTAARQAIFGQERVMEWGTPVLFLRTGNGALWS